MITIRATGPPSTATWLTVGGTRRCSLARPSLDPPYRYAVGRAALRRLRIQHGPGSDDGASAALADGGHRLARWLAPDLRRGGPRLGGGAGHPCRGPPFPGGPRALRRVRVG